MNKKILLVCILLQIFTMGSKAQTQCGSTFNTQLIQASDPSRYSRYVQLEQHTSAYISSLNSSNISARLINPNSIIIIPVVIHVLHNGTPVGVGNNISDAQALSQIDVLNEDFRRQNANRINTPAAFMGVAADPNIEFRLACIDPNGSATNGINRVQTTKNAFTCQLNSNGSINEIATGIKFTSQGGTDAWPTNKYLNIWVCNIAPFTYGQVLGYAQFPFDYATSPNTDGVVILNSAFGRVGNLRFQYEQGRTTTHEVGHWLNLFHVWGDDSNNPDICSGSDQCDDTPNQGIENSSNCPYFPNVSCNNGPNGDMFMNYMDYTFDGCKNIFTKGQTNRMRAVFAPGGPRASFIDNYFKIKIPPNTSFCNSTTLTLTNTACLPVTWTITSGQATISSPNNKQATINAVGKGSIVVRVTANGYFDEITLNSFNQSPTQYTLYPSYTTTGYSNWLQDINCLKTYAFPGMYSGNIDLFDQVATSYNWTFVSKSPSTATVGIGPTSDPQHVTVTVKPQNAYAIYRLTSSNVCGSYSKDYRFVANGTCLSSSMMASSTQTDLSAGYSSSIGQTTLSASPNPSTGIVSLKLNSVFPEILAIQQVMVVNKLGLPIKQIKISGKMGTAQINISELPFDLYEVRVFDGNKWYSTKLLKQ